MVGDAALELDMRVDSVVARMDKIDIKMSHLCSRQSEMLNLLHNIDTNVRSHSETLAAHAQWLEDHEAVHKASEKRIDGLAGRVNVFAGINGAIAAVMAAVAAWISGRG